MKYTSGVYPEHVFQQREWLRYVCMFGDTWRQHDSPTISI